MPTDLPPSSNSLEKPNGKSSDHPSAETRQVLLWLVSAILLGISALTASPWLLLAATVLCLTLIAWLGGGPGGPLMLFAVWLGCAVGLLLALSGSVADGFLSVLMLVAVWLIPIGLLPAAFARRFKTWIRRC